MAIQVRQQTDANRLFNIEILSEPTRNDHALDHGKIQAGLGEQGREAGIDRTLAVNQIFQVGRRENDLPLCKVFPFCFLGCSPSDCDLLEATHRTYPVGPK